MSGRDELALLTPRLRRYARALLLASPAPSEAADALVHAALERVVDCGMPERKADLLLQLFSVLTQVTRESQQERATGAAAGMASGLTAVDDTVLRSSRQTGASKGICAALGALRLEDREALFLVGVEGFTYAQAARILHISRSTLLARLARARGRLGEILANEAGAQSPGRRAPHLRVIK